MDLLIREARPDDARATRSSPTSGPTTWPASPFTSNWAFGSSARRNARRESMIATWTRSSSKSSC